MVDQAEGVQAPAPLLPHPPGLLLPPLLLLQSLAQSLPPPKRLQDSSSFLALAGPVSLLLTALWAPLAHPGALEPEHPGQDPAPWLCDLQVLPLPAALSLSLSLSLSPPWVEGTAPAAQKAAEDPTPPEHGVNFALCPQRVLY